MAWYCLHGVAIGVCVCVKEEEEEEEKVKFNRHFYLHLTLITTLKQFTDQFTCLGKITFWTIRKRLRSIILSDRD